jgi:hypothetical protein
LILLICEQTTTPFKKMKICFIIFLIALSILACKEGRNLQNIKEDFSTTIVDTSQINLDSIIKNLPDYETLVAQILTEKYAYNSKHLLQNKSIAGLNSKESALLFGMHSSDLAYARYHERVQDCKDILSELHILAEQLAIPPDMLNTAISEAEAGIDNPELVFQVADSLFYIADEFLNVNEMYGISAIIASGAYIESMRILSQINSNTSTQTKINTDVYYSISKVLNAFKGDEYIKWLDQELNTLHTAYINGNLNSIDFEYFD